MEWQLDPSPTQAGDIVVCVADKHVGNYTPGKLYIVLSVEKNYTNTVLDDSGSETNGWQHKNFKKVLSYPGDHAIEGDHIIAITKHGLSQDAKDKYHIGEVYRCQRHTQWMYWSTKHPEKYATATRKWLVVMPKVDNRNNETAPYKRPEYNDKRLYIIDEGKSYI